MGHRSKSRASLAISGPFGGPGMFGGDGPDLAKFIYEAYFHELGARLAPTVDKLLDKLIDGSAGDVPTWGWVP